MPRILVVDDDVDVRELIELALDAARTSIRPPSGVNLIAFERRFNHSLAWAQPLDQIG